MGHSRKNRGLARREQLRAEGDERQELRATMSNAQQIESLNRRLGVGGGAKKERARLMQEIDEMKAKQKKKNDRKTSSKSDKSMKAKDRREHESSKVRRGAKG